MQIGAIFLLAFGFSFSFLGALYLLFGPPDPERSDYLANKARYAHTQAPYYLGFGLASLALGLVLFLVK